MIQQIQMCSFLFSFIIFTCPILFLNICTYLMLLLYSLYEIMSTQPLVTILILIHLNIT